MIRVAYGVFSHGALLRTFDARADVRLCVPNGTVETLTFTRA